MTFFKLKVSFCPLQDLNFFSEDKLLLHIRYLFQNNLVCLFVFPLSPKLSFTLSSQGLELLLITTVACTHMHTHALICIHIPSPFYSRHILIIMFNVYKILRSVDLGVSLFLSYLVLSSSSLLLYHPAFSIC